MQRARSFLLNSFVLAGAALAVTTFAASTAEARGGGRGFAGHGGLGARSFGHFRAPFAGRRFFANGRRNGFAFGRFGNRRFARGFGGFGPWGGSGWGYPGWGYGWGGLWGGYGPYDSGSANTAPAADNAPQPDMGALMVPTVVGIRAAPEGTPTVYVIEVARGGASEPPASPAPRNGPLPGGQRGGGLSDKPSAKIVEVPAAMSGVATPITSSFAPAETAAADGGPRIVTVRLP